MKLKFKLFLLLLLFSGVTVFAGGNEYTRNIHRAFSKSDVAALNIQNKYGAITINDMGGDSVTIDVAIVVENAYEGKAEYLLKQIDIEIGKSGKTVTAVTKISSDFKTKQKFSINYKVNIPSDRNLDITNKYGNLSVGKLTGQGKFVIGYGNITTGDMKAPANGTISLDLSYGKADIEAVNRLNANIKYSKLFMDKAEQLQLDSKYSTISIDNVGELKAISKYDGFSLDKAGSITADSKYTHYSIDKLSKKLVLTSEYGNVDIDDVDDEFETIEITSSYGEIALGLDKKAYRIHAECSYCNVAYPHDQFSGNREKDNNNLRIDGKINNGSANVHIISRYGGVKLFN